MARLLELLYGCFTSFRGELSEAFHANNSGLGAWKPKMCLVGSSSQDLSHGIAAFDQRQPTFVLVSRYDI